MTFDILPFSHDHLDAVEALEKRCFSDPFSRSMLESALTNERAFAFVALSGGEVAGYLELYDSVDSLYVCSIETAPEFRRMGLADLFLEKTDEVAEERKLPLIALEVRVSNAPAVALYEKHGYERVGIRRDYYAKPREDAAVYFKHISTFQEN